MFVYRTIEKKVFREFDSIVMQNMSHNLLLFCTQTWQSHHVIENHLYQIDIRHSHPVPIRSNAKFSILRFLHSDWLTQSQLSVPPDKTWLAPWQYVIVSIQLTMRV